VVTWSPECGHPPASVTYDLTCTLFELSEIDAPQNVQEGTWLLLGTRQRLPFKSKVAAISLDGAQNAAHVAVEAFVTY